MDLSGGAAQAVAVTAHRALPARQVAADGEIVGQRGSRSRHTEPYRLGDLTVDHVARSVTVSGRAARLTPTEYKVLHELCANAGRVLTYDQLLERVWGEGSAGDPRRVRTLVKDLRRKLGDDARSSRYILTVPGVDYRAPTVP